MNDDGGGVALLNNVDERACDPRQLIVGRLIQLGLQF